VSAAVLRPYTGAHDLRRMQDALSGSLDRGAWHPGDLAWSMRDQPHLQLAPTVTLVESAGGELLGWVWFHAYGWFDAIAVAEDDGQLADLLVATAIDTAARCAEAGDPLLTLSALCDEEDTALGAALAGRGFTVTPDVLEVTRRSLDDLPAATVPEGLRLAGVEDDALADARVEAHQAAFAPSRLTLFGFRRVRRTWPYRGELDRVVVDDAGRVLASCLAWIDEASGWGILEPVGTRPEHRRRGLAAAVCLDALHALRAAGAHSAQVSCEGGSAGCATYHSIGFRTERRMAIHRRVTA
jgi:predicted N-acetyltransferase YhbS